MEAVGLAFVTVKLVVAVPTPPSLSVMVTVTV
jgi:hypothetical protein